MNFRVELPLSLKASDTFHVLRKKASLLSSYSHPLQTVRQSTNGTQTAHSVELEKIIDHQKKAMGYSFQVKFKGSSTPDNYEWKTTTELKKSIPRLLSSYVQDHPDLKNKFSLREGCNRLYPKSVLFDINASLFLLHLDFTDDASS